MKIRALLSHCPYWNVIQVTQHEWVCAGDIETQIFLLQPSPLPVQPHLMEYRQGTGLSGRISNGTFQADVIRCHRQIHNVILSILHATQVPRLLLHLAILIMSIASDPTASTASPTGRVVSMCENTRHGKLADPASRRLIFTSQPQVLPGTKPKTQFTSDRLNINLQFGIVVATLNKLFVPE